jgi:hypothetical protein
MLFYPTKTVSYELRFCFLLISVSGTYFPTFGVIFPTFKKTQNLFLIMFGQKIAPVFRGTCPIPR